MGVETGMRERMEAIAARFPQRLSALIPILYLVQRIERSCAGVARAVEILDRTSLAQGRPITVPLARSALGLG